MKSIKEFLRHLHESELQFVASALAFTSMMSLIPFCAVTLSVLGNIDAFDSLYPKVETLVLNYLQGPAGAEGTAIVRKILYRIQQGQLGKIGAITLFLTSILLLRNMELAVNRIWRITKRRKVWKQVISYWLIFLSAPIALAVYVGVSSQRALKSITGETGWAAVNIILIFLFLYLAFRLVPYRQVSHKAALFGSIFSALGLKILFSIFGWLTKAVFNYSKVYGSIAAFPALLVWMLLIWYVILGGVAVSAAYQARLDSKVPA